MQKHEARGLLPYVARLHADWHATDPEQLHRQVTGTLVFADISGFTALTEKLARKGKVGAEEMSDALNLVFSDILQPAHDDGADLVKWGGDAVLLLFAGDHHAARACRAAYGMRARLRTLRPLGNETGTLRLRMSVGIHSGQFDFFLVGDVEQHRELLVSGPEVSRVVRLESRANAGEIALSHATVAETGAEYAGQELEEGRLLKICPEPPRTPVVGRQRTSVDVRTLLPTEIRQHLLRGDADPEHRDIAVGFVKFTGTDRIAQEDGPEAVGLALDEAIRNIASACYQFGVTFFETDLDADGGKVMLAAGVPTSAGHHAERMLRATSLMLEQRGRLELKIGVNFGHVFAGDFGPPFRRTYSIKGDPINLAARVMGKAAPGTLLATRAAVEHSETIFDTTALEPFMVKGKAHPVEAYVVGRVLKSPRDRRSHASLLVGRAAELEQIETALDRLEWSQGQAIEIVGPPGIGKSRLLSEAVRMAGDRTVYVIQCVEYDAATPYHLIWVLLHNVLKLEVGASDTVEIFRSHVERVAPDLLPWFPLLCVPLEHDVADTPTTRGLEEDFRRSKTEEVVVDLLYRLLPKASLLVFDDVQYLDSASVAVVNRLVAGVSSRPLLVILGRQEADTGWRVSEGSEVATIKLEPLSATESMRMVQAANSDHPLPPRLAQQLAAKAAGNPLFLQSLLQEAGPSGDVASLPDSVSELVTVQIDRLPPYEKTVLRRASVLGTGFDLEQLPLLFDEPPPEEALEGLSDFLQVESGRRWVSFRHAMIREVAYEGLPYKARRELHGRIGTALERAGGAAGARPELLSLHFFHAHRFDKAWAYARNAGDQARQQYAHTEAVEQFSRAVEAARRLPKQVVPRVALGQTYMSMADSWFTIGLVEEADRAYRYAAPLVRSDRVQAAELAVSLAWVDQRLRRFSQSLRRLTIALHNLEGVPGAKAHATRSRLLSAYAKARWSQGRIRDAIAWSTRAVDEARLGNDPEILATRYSNLQAYYLVAGEPPPEPYGEMALELRRELGDIAGQAFSTNNLAVEAQAAFRWADAYEMYTRAADMFASIGDTSNEGEATYNRSEVLVDQGRFMEAVPLLEHALLAARSASDEELVGYVLRLVGRAYAGAGNVVGGLAALNEARALFERIDEPQELAEVDFWRAVAFLLDGDSQAARTLAEGLLAGAEDDRAAGLHWVRGFALLEDGEADLASQEFTVGVEAAEAAGARYALALNYLGLARCGGALAAQWEARAAEVLGDLDVVSLPLPG